MSSEERSDLRPATWLWPAWRERQEQWLAVMVPATAAEMAAALGVSVDRAIGLQASDPMYFFLGPDRWLGRN
jgi:hypothetical protein